MSDYLSHAKSVVTEACKKLSPAEFIKSEAAVMSRDELEHLAAAYLLAQVKMRNRAVTLTVERDSERVVVPAPAADPVRLAEFRAEQAERDARNVSKLVDIVSAATAKFAAELRMEWTRELLDSEFALGDGTTVRWGDATMDQHEYRYQLHARNAQAGLEGAARHKEAIDTLNTTGASTLREAVAVAA